MSALMLHCGANRASYDEVYDVVTPPRTETHVPVPHAYLVNEVRNRIQAQGLTLKSEDFGLWGDDNQRFFGVFEVALPTQTSIDASWVIGLRNSHDKTMSGGVVAGSRVFVCDNLAFSGEVKFMRKHTSGIFRDMPGILDRAFQKLYGFFRTQEERHAAYKTIAIPEWLAHHIVIRALDRGIITVTKVQAVLDQWRDSQHEEFRARSLWSLFNAFTEVFKSTSAVTLPERSEKLYYLADQVTDSRRTGLMVR